MSAFANRTGGGVILFGLDESTDFSVVGVTNPLRLQAEIGDLASSEMEPALRPDFTVEDIDGKTVVAVDIADVPTAQRPCYYKPAGLQKGSYIRVGNTNRQMTDYEIFGYVSARAQPTFDEEVSYIQVRLFADRLEVQSPGGLFGNVTEENLEEENSTRNSVLMRLMEDLHLVENRGSGIRAMLEAMRRANLEPPRFDDKRSSFWVMFRNHMLMSPEAVTWLNQFATLPLNDRQRLALVYLRCNDQITNSDIRGQEPFGISSENRRVLHSNCKAEVTSMEAQPCDAQKFTAGNKARIAGLVVVELKAKSEIPPIDKSQTLLHLRLLNPHFARLINFHEVRLVDGVRRIVNGYGSESLKS